MKKEFFGLLCGCTLLPAFLHAQTERPNIVIVLADDLGWGDEGQPTEMRAFEHMPGKRK